MIYALEGSKGSIQLLTAHLKVIGCSLPSLGKLISNVLMTMIDKDKLQLHLVVLVFHGRKVTFTISNYCLMYLQ